MTHRNATARGYRRLGACVAACLLAGPAAVLAQQQDYAVPPAAPAEPAPATLAPLEPKPALRRAVLLHEVRGRVTYRLPGQSRDRALERPTAVPMRTIVDATAGRVRLTVERDRRGRTSRAVFFDGRFRVSQGGGDRPITHLRLVGEVPDCAASSMATASARRKRRRLWGDGRGRFRTRGRYSAATVRGTKWLVEDRCDGTLTRVARGEVEVIDYAPLADPPAADQSPAGAEGAPAPVAAPTPRRARRVRVRRGGSYVARPG